MILSRRDALTLAATVCGSTLFGANRLLAGAANALGGFSFSSAERGLLNEIADTIIPSTADSGGAKDAEVGSFMEEIVRDFYAETERAAFMSGLDQLQTLSRSTFAGRTFEDLTLEERTALLMMFENPNPTPEYYRMIKQLTVWGYFSSEVGAKQALAYLPVPGRYQACITVDPGSTKAWAY